MRSIALSFAVLLACSPAQADFFKDILNVIEETAKDTAEDIIADKTEQMIRDMVIGYESEQTRSEEEVLEEYEEETGSIPTEATVSGYRSQMSPGAMAKPGEKITISSVIKIVPGTDGRPPLLEERLTIFDNEDTSMVLKTLTKEAQKSSGGEFRSEFTFSLPDGMPQGVYPVRTTLLLNGELAGDRKYELQLVMTGAQGAARDTVAHLDAR
ncbi:MAG: hypothetical protein CME59_10105 [Halioglobus sp.]|nr:hypothetical protein [Halioglobus sp.]|tara:strand:+ start:2381 stop:3016 length:636 start_codon:yes stop_codon:yes gene_type:complete